MGTLPLPTRRKYGTVGHTFDIADINFEVSENLFSPTRRGHSFEENVRERLRLMYAGLQRMSIGQRKQVESLKKFSEAVFESFMEVKRELNELEAKCDRIERRQGGHKSGRKKKRANKRRG